MSSFCLGFVKVAFWSLFSIYGWFGILQMFFLNGWRWQPFFPSKTVFLGMLAT
jgi:hypothetical protein